MTKSSCDPFILYDTFPTKDDTVLDYTILDDTVLDDTILDDTILDDTILLSVHFIMQDLQETNKISNKVLWNLIENVMYKIIQYIYINRIKLIMDKNPQIVLSMYSHISCIEQLLDLPQTIRRWETFFSYIFFETLSHKLNNIIKS